MAFEIKLCPTVNSSNSAYSINSNYPSQPSQLFFKSCKSWLRFTQERFPFLVYLLLCGGFVASAFGLSYLPSILTFSTSSIVEGLPKGLYCLFGLLLFFFLLRLMDEVKDFEKDKIANPLRPLPRGLLSIKSAKAGIGLLWALGGLYAFFTFVFFSLLASFCFLFLWIYLWLMYKEFFIGETLVKKPFLYGLSHQIILIPLCYFSVLVFNPSLFFSKEVLLYSLVVLGSFFGYEISRKLDPKAHPILKTYLQHYGLQQSLLLIVLTQFFAASISFYWKQPFLLFIESFFGMSLLFFVIINWNKKSPQLHINFKLIELLASLSLIFHIWSAFLTLFL